MRVGTTSAGSQHDDRPRHHRRDRARRRLVVAAASGAALTLSVVACTTSPDAAAPSPESSTAAAGAADDAQLPIGTLDARPVLEVLPPQAAAGVDVLTDNAGMMSYRLGPQADRRPAILSTRAQQGVSGAWEVVPVLAPGADGIDRFNEQARRCHAQGPDCPTGQLAIVVDGTVMSAPRIEPDQPTFTPFTADQITISGGLSEADARAFALALPAP